MTPIDPATLSATQRPKSGVVTPLNRAAPTSAAANGADTAKGSEATSALTSAAAEAPVDADRVAEIRKAVENGTYPLIPYRVADAMIAAGFLLRAPK